MNFQLTLVLCLQIVSILTAPLQLQLLNPMQQPLQQQIPVQISQQSSLQQQMIALQQLQALQRLSTVHSPSMLYLPQPMLLLLPNLSSEDVAEEDSKFKTANENDSADNDLKHTETEYVDENLDSVIVEAEPNVRKNKPVKEPMQAILLLPNGRFSIGEFISGIPWLPFEVNVPDTISWAYNGVSSGISGIISIIGQRLPFRPRPQSESMIRPKDMYLKMFFKQLQMKKHNSVTPVLVLPLDGMMLPIETMLPVQM